MLKVPFLLLKNKLSSRYINKIYNSIIMSERDFACSSYEHPYQVELKLYHPSSELIDPDPEAPEFPPPLEKTPLTLVETEAQVDALVEHLSQQPEMAVDLEHHSYRSYQGKCRGSAQKASVVCH